MNVARVEIGGLWVSCTGDWGVAFCFSNTYCGTVELWDGDDRIYRLVCVWSVVSCYLQLVVEYLGPGPVM